MTLDCTKINLKEGSKGSEVKELQEGLKKLGYYKVINGYTMVVDGVFGGYTKIAVERFQRDTGHDDDGWFGPKTCPDFNKKLNGTTGNTTTSNGTKVADNKVRTSATKKEVIIDAKKYNFVRVSEANCTIEGIHFIIESLTDTTSFKVKPKKSVELMADNFHRYTGHIQPLQYKLVTTISDDEYNKVKNALILMQQKICNIVCSNIESGKYYVDVTRSHSNISTWQLTFEITEAI